ncbi:MAG: HAD family hydrolase [Acidobacteria bacterium]|nr:HAD family hydrolase [Acidobacteriota bacterium]
MSGPRAIVFDVDGTLYDAGPLRWRMAIRLVRGYAGHPWRLWRAARVLSAWRRALEELRRSEAAWRIPGDQYRRAAELCGVGEDQVRALVGQWFEEAPLELLGGAARPGLRELLTAAQAKGISLAVLSDYPAQAKLEALGLAEFFSAVTSAGDADVQAYKPDPRGLLATLARLGVAPERAIYVGDRAEVDGECARRAGVRFVEAPADFGRLSGLL